MCSCPTHVARPSFVSLSPGHSPSLPCLPPALQCTPPTRRSPRQTHRSHLLGSFAHTRLVFLSRAGSSTRHIRHGTPGTPLQVLSDKWSSRLEDLVLPRRATNRLSWSDGSSPHHAMADPETQVRASPSLASATAPLKRVFSPDRATLCSSRCAFRGGSRRSLAY